MSSLQTVNMKAALLITVLDWQHCVANNTMIKQELSKTTTSMMVSSGLLWQISIDIE